MTVNRLRGYELGARLGAAPGVTLFLARHNVSGRQVGVQLLDAGLVALPGFVNRLAAVAAQVAPLRHPRVVGTDEVVFGDHVAAVVTEPAAGVPLSDLMSAGVPLPLTTAMVVVDDVLRAIGAAHAAGLVHCGVIPARVLVEAGGEARLDGFAMARALALTGGDAGAPPAGYSSPERLGGVLPDGLGDLYAAAALAHALLTGSTASPGVAGPVPELPALSTVLGHALAADPRRRYPSAAALRNALTGTVAEALGPEWRQRSDLGERARALLVAADAGHEVGGDAGAGGQRPGRSGPGARALAEPGDHAAGPPEPVVPPVAPASAAQPAPEPPGASSAGVQPPPALAPVATRRARRVWPIVVAGLLAVGLIGGGGAALYLTVGPGANGGSSSATPTPGRQPLQVGPPSVTVTKAGAAGCDVVYTFLATGPLTGSGSLTYHWEGSDGSRTDATTIGITNQVGLHIEQNVRRQGAQSGSLTLTFVITAPQPRSVARTVDVTCQP